MSLAVAPLWIKPSKIQKSQHIDTNIILEMKKGGSMMKIILREI